MMINGDGFAKAVLTMIAFVICLYIAFVVIRGIAKIILCKHAEASARRMIKKLEEEFKESD